ncbi:nucleotide sugar dehydrogenase [Pseudonocardiaceae bacterium YIM PH 21723]|nr:nucleotide sugar dehydrogenase [Pseudonocardiaceae bacterium YIM PH 21723]
MANLVVVGLGYVGLPLAFEACVSGIATIGLDKSTQVAVGLNAGKSHIKDVADSALRVMLESGFRATTEAGVLRDADVAVICVPTPLNADGLPDLTAVRGAAETVGANLSKGTLVVLESTTYPGTTEDVIRPILERASGLSAGTDFALAFSPERIDPGNSEFGLRNTPKVVGGITAQCTEVARQFYGALCDNVIMAKSAREAEMSKLIENTYRNINIALVNELATVANLLKVDIWDSIDCAATKPFGFQAFYPGPGVGGHCIPIDPIYLSHSARLVGSPMRMIELARDINATMPGFIIQRCCDQLSHDGKTLFGARILLAGVTFKANSADMNSTPAENFVRQLRTKGSLVSFCDPHVQQWSVDDTPVHKVDDLGAGAEESDLIILLQCHNEFSIDSVENSGTPIFDTRGKIRSGKAFTF